MTLRKFLFPITLAFATVMGVPATAQAQPTLDEITTAVAQSGPLLVEAEVKQVLPSVNSPTQQAAPGPPSVLPAIPVAPALPVAPAPVAEPVTAPVVAVAPAPPPASRLGGEITLADIRQEPPNALPQQKAGEKWTPIRVHTEVRSLPNATAVDGKLEVVTRNGGMFGVQYVNYSGEFSGNNATDSFSGYFTDARAEIWGGRYDASQDGRTRWSVNAFVRQLTHTNSGKGQSRPGTEYPYSYSWKNAPRPITQLGGRARIEGDLIQSPTQQLTLHLEGEAAATVAGESGLAFNAKTGVWYRTAHVEAYGEVCVNNTGVCFNGHGRYYLTKSGQLRPFVEAGGEVGTGYSNLRVGGGIQVGIGKNGYGEFAGGYNTGTSGNGLALMGRAGIRL